MKKIITSLLIIGFLPILVHADLYKWKDKYGRMNYTDTPPPADVKVDSLKANAAVPNSLPPAKKVMGKDGKEIVKDGEKKLDDDAAKRQQSAEEQKKADAKKAEEAKQKEANCKTSRQNLASLANGGRIYKTKDNGEREYMNDKDIDQNKRSAQQEVNKYCN